MISMYKILDGRIIAEKIKKRLKAQVVKMKQKPGLAVVYIGNDPVSLAYIRKKQEAARQIGVDFFFHKLAEKSSSKKTIALIGKLNKQENVNGIIVQLPLPKHLSKKEIIDAIALKKDVDVLNSKARKSLESGRPQFAPPPARAVLELVHSAKRSVKNSTVVVVGRGMLVGEPVAELLKNQAKRLIVCDQETQNLSAETKKADILISATGKPNLIESSMVKKRAVVIDAGTARYKGKIVGDVDFKNVAPKTSYITPVPGGVGPITVVMLLANTVKAAKRAVKPYKP